MVLVEVSSIVGFCCNSPSSTCFLQGGAGIWGWAVVFKQHQVAWIGKMEELLGSCTQFPEDSDGADTFVIQGEVTGLCLHPGLHMLPVIWPWLSVCQARPPPFSVKIYSRPMVHPA